MKERALARDYMKKDVDPGRYLVIVTSALTMKSP